MEKSEAQSAPAESFETIVEAARDAFWAAIGERYPMVKSGDFPPEATFAFDEACNVAVRTWLDSNLPAGTVIRTADGYRLTKTEDGNYTDGDLEFNSLSSMEIDFDVLTEG